MTREERVALAAYRAFTPVVAEVGGTTVLSAPEAPGSPMLNRAVGLGVDTPATEAHVEAVLGAFDRGVAYYVAVSPSAGPPELPRWLEERGLEPGWGWMSFRRPAAPMPAAVTGLRVREVENGEDAAAFARIVRLGYALPEAVEPLVARAPDAGWRCWLALDGDEPAAAAGMYVAERAAYLGFAATLPEHRGKGAQNALLATRIARAAEHGCDVVLTETGERRHDLPSSSYRNILRSGFEEIAVTANWLGRT